MSQFISLQVETGPGSLSGSPAAEAVGSTSDPAEVDGLRAQVAQKDAELKEANRLLAELREQVHSANAEIAQYSAYLGTVGFVAQYRQAYDDANGHVAQGAALPDAHAWPAGDDGLSYEEKLLCRLPVATGRGVEVGPLNIPVTSKSKANVLYVDHLDTEGLREKYGSTQGIVDIDRPIVNNSLQETLEADAPLDYLVGSQVFEHVANPIRWLREIAAILRVGGLLSISLPDRRLTFDFLREETRPADMIAAFMEDATVPDTRCVYDHHSLTRSVNMHWANPASVYPQEIVDGRGAVKPKIITIEHMPFVRSAKDGEYLDVHAWVFTPPSFLLAMAQIAADGFLPYRLHQFYPTNPKSCDRGSSSFVAIMERTSSDVPGEELRRSYLTPLGE